jgi:hypothetical protein
MQVTNLTDNCYILSGVVILEPNAIETVSDDAYQNDSTLNAQIDALETRGHITITGKPSDPFPSRGQTITANDKDTTPLVLEAATGQEVDLFQAYDDQARLRVRVKADGNLVVLDTFTFQILQTVSDGSWAANQNGFYIAGDPAVVGFGADDAEFNTGLVASPEQILLHQRHERAAAPVFQLIPLASGTERIVEILDRSGAVTFAINSDGTIHIKSGATIHADL